MSHGFLHIKRGKRKLFRTGKRFQPYHTHVIASTGDKKRHCAVGYSPAQIQVNHFLRSGHGGAVLSQMFTPKRQPKRTAWGQRDTYNGRQQSESQHHCTYPACLTTALTLLSREWVCPAGRSFGAGLYLNISWHNNSLIHGKGSLGDVTNSLFFLLVFFKKTEKSIAFSTKYHEKVSNNYVYADFWAGTTS